jgi:hypothetical protein
MGAAVALEQSRSAPLLHRQEEATIENQHGIGNQSGMNEEKRILMIQASANWHKMILHANQMKQSQSETNDRFQRVQESMALYPTITTETTSGGPIGRGRGRGEGEDGIDEKEISWSQSELVSCSTPNISRVSSSPDLKLSPSKASTSASNSPKPKIDRQKSIQAMGAQFRREELERIRQEEEKAKANSPKKTKKSSPTKRSFPHTSLQDFENLPPVRIDLKSRTSNSL